MGINDQTNLIRSAMVEGGVFATIQALREECSPKGYFYDPKAKTLNAGIANEFGLLLTQYPKRLISVAETFGWNDAWIGQGCPTEIPSWDGK